MLTIALAPFVLISLFLTVCCELEWLTSPSYIALASIHAASCIGDFYLSYILISQKEEILVEDRIRSMLCFEFDGVKHSHLF